MNQVDLKVVQDFIVKAGKTTNTLQVSLDIFNIGNLLKDTWGISKVPVNSGRILKYEGVTADNVPTYSMYQSDGKLPTETFSYLKTAQTAGKFRWVYDIYSTNGLFSWDIAAEYLQRYFRQYSFLFSSIMKRQILSILLILGLIAPVMGKSRKVVIKIMETTDIHGNFFGYDFKENHPLEGGLPQVASYVRSQRDSLGKENCILVDAGDVLQGQPCVYYTNFIDTKSPHLASEMMNFMGYDAAAFGNHDIEAGHPVFNRWVADCSFPVLGANILSKANGKPYAKPYCIVEREGVKIAILGMITPAIPMWLPEKLWQGLQFEDMVESAKKWVPFILEKEKPDVMVGLFHCGLKSHGQNGYNENPAEEIARNIPGLDILFYGHDHQAYCQQVTNNVSGNNVWLLNAGGETVHVAEAILTCSVDDGNVTDKK